jgi:hypothetical protein
VAHERCDSYDAQAIRRHAEGFGRTVFLERMRRLIDEQLAQRRP